MEENDQLYVLIIFPLEISPQHPCIEGWVGPTASQDAWRKENNSPCQKSNSDSSIIQPIA
jgi:hypothetical protein